MSGVTEPDNPPDYPQRRRLQRDTLLSLLPAASLDIPADLRVAFGAGMKKSFGPREPTSKGEPARQCDLDAFRAPSAFEVGSGKS